MMAAPMKPAGSAMEGDPGAMPPPVESTPKKKGRTNTPWTAEEEQRLKNMRDQGRSWSEIAKVRALSVISPASFLANLCRMTRRRLSPHELKAV